MRGLVEADLTATRQAKGRSDPPRLLCHLGAVDVLGLERPDEPVQVVAHEIEDGSEEGVSSMGLHEVAVRGVDRGFRGRQPEDHPSVTGIDERKSQHVAEEPRSASGSWL